MISMNVWMHSNGYFQNVMNSLQKHLHHALETHPAHIAVTLAMWHNKALVHLEYYLCDG